MLVWGWFQGFFFKLKKEQPKVRGFLDTRLPPSSPSRVLWVTLQLLELRAGNSGFLQLRQVMGGWGERLLPILPR